MLVATKKLLEQFYFDVDGLLLNIEKLLQTKNLFERKDFHEILINASSKDPDNLKIMGSEPLALMLFCSLESDLLGKVGFQEEGFNLPIDYDLNKAGKVKGKILYFFKKD